MGEDRRATTAHWRPRSEERAPDGEGAGVASRPTLQDVAREAGVSAASASHALNNKGRLEASTRQRVLDAAERLGYRADPRGRALRTGRTFALGLVTSLPVDQDGDHDSRLDWYTRTAMAAAVEAMRQGYALMMVPPLGQESWARSLPVDGLLLIGPDPDPEDALIAALAERGLPTALIGGSPAPGAAFHDRAEALDLALGHVERHGARTPALVVDDRFRSLSADTRVAYEAWCAARSLTPLVATVDLRSPGSRTARARETCRTLLLDHPGIDAVYAPLDSVAAGCLQAARSLNRTVPGDLRLITTEGAIARDSDPPLPAIDTHREAQATAAVQMLITELTTGTKPPGRSFRPTLIER
jgi:DNA-binding LacI/PurR family transcriptional regulator